MNYSEKEEHVFVVECYFRYGESVKVVQSEFRKAFPIRGDHSKLDKKISGLFPPMPMIRRVQYTLQKTLNEYVPVYRGGPRCSLRKRSETLQFLMRW